jgi:hypothetical protein
MVNAHAIKVSRVYPIEQAKSISSLKTRNPSLKSSFKILSVAWREEAFKLPKAHRSLLLK